MALEKKLKHAIKSNDIEIIHSVFNEIYITYGKLVYFKISQYVNNKLDVEELTQDVFVNFYNNVVNNEIHDIKYYLLVSAKNKAIDFLKKKKELLILDDKIIFETEEDITSNIEYEELINKMKIFLSDLDIEIIIKHNINGDSFKQLAKEYKKPLNTILSIYHRALKKFKKGSEKSEKNK